jgi:8-oxo-dGTP pyrophosphatase MutT (NUDIX family)
MVITIHFHDKPVYLCDELTTELKEILHHPDAVFVDEISTPAINSLLHEIKKDDFHAGVIYHNDLEKLRKAFFKHFTLIEAAGGIVQNEKKELLFIYRLDNWDLPKGKIESGESPESAAHREIEEETGITGLSLKKKIGETFHTYDAYGKHFLKTTHWFYFTVEGKHTLKPQLEEDITLIKWFSTKQIKTPMDDTYASIREIVKLYFDTP